MKGKIIPIIKEIRQKYEKNLRERLLNFSVSIMKFINSFPSKREFDVFRYQLSKSATSIGANYEESQTATYKEFINRIRIALREANETAYWLKIIGKLNIGNNTSGEFLISEIGEICKIFGSIYSRSIKK